MNSISNLVRFNLHHLRQGQRLIEQVSDDVFSCTQKPIFESSIGEHVRHVFEHYACFLSGLDSQQIDYDARDRDTRISTDRSFAASHCRSLYQALEQVEGNELKLSIKMTSSQDHDDPAPWTDSNIERELQYLQAHTIHHYALIAMILRIQGLDSEADFGVAPSTIRHRSTQAMSAAL